MNKIYNHWAEREKQNNKTLDRREFLKAGAVGTALGVGAFVAGNTKAPPSFAATELDEIPNRITDEYKRFDHKYTVFARGFWDPEMIPQMMKFAVAPTRNEIGYSKLDKALFSAGWAVEDRFAEWSKMGNTDTDMYQWRNWTNPEKWEFEGLEDASRKVKRAAKHLGASLVGIAKYNPMWTYSSVMKITKFQHSDPEHWARVPADAEFIKPDFPFEPKSVVVMAVEEEYDAIACTPTFISTGASGLGYSRMAELGWSVQRFLSELGYQSFANGNDTTLSVPYAVEAGLGEACRIGVVLTPEYGPRIRLVKVFTELELKPDKPKVFGAAEFCKSCKRCAESCPSKAITFGEPTLEGPTISNNPGVEKWYANPEKCFSFWIENGTYGCANCIASCPFNKSDMWNHRMIARLTELPGAPLHKAMVKMDGLFGYGNTFDKQASIRWWEEG
jgi:reductive dehalogenase